jgi:hypothetical protein
MPIEIENKTLIANRIPPGDRWSLIGEEKIYPSITEVLNAYFEKVTVKPLAYRLEPLNNKIYALQTSTEPDPEPKKYSIYGDYTI